MFVMRYIRKIIKLILITSFPITSYASFKLSPQFNLMLSNKQNFSSISLESSISRDEFKAGFHLAAKPLIKDKEFHNNIFIETEYGGLEFGNQPSSFEKMELSWSSIFPIHNHQDNVNISYYSPKTNALVAGISYSESKQIDLCANYSFQINDIDLKLAFLSKTQKKKTSLNIGILSSRGPYIFIISYGPNLSSTIAYIQGPFSIFVGFDGAEKVITGAGYKFSKYLTPYLQFSLHNKEIESMAGISIRL
jgi:hypothetical protein